MKIKLTIISLLFLLTGCTLIEKYNPMVDRLPKVTEENYRQTPCIWDGATL